MKPPFGRPDMRRAVILAPSGFTLANLFFGIFAIVAASRGEFNRAALFVVLGGVMDTLDGRVARATKTGSRFGEELDSLVDAITFGTAPALIMYFVVLNKEGWDWIWAFLFTACAVIRLARFNVEQAGRAKTHFHGLPSPAAGMTLAAYYPFSQSSLYLDTIIGDIPWHMTMRFVMVGLAFLMVSDVAYPAVPTIGYRTPRQIMGSIIVAGTVIGVFVLRLEFFFPALALYIMYGVIKTVLLGLMERRGAAEELLEEEEVDGVAVIPPHEPQPDDDAAAFDLSQGGRRRRRRGRRRNDPNPVPPVDPGRESGA